ncbi:hypothetical protein ACIGKR_29745 [Rhodococcus qingshengii]|uniref:hypothetical protein n=1 Tax=Rhodococcus qingshengii TaxID=334542 RepID=UPI0037C54526
MDKRRAIRNEKAIRALRVGLGSLIDLQGQATYEAMRATLPPMHRTSTLRSSHQAIASALTPAS